MTEDKPDQPDFTAISEKWYETARYRSDHQANIFSYKDGYEDCFKNHVSAVKEENKRLQEEIEGLKLPPIEAYETVEKLKEENNELREACNTVVKGYEGDGMEQMNTRDHIFYKVCSTALIERAESTPLEPVKSLQECKEETAVRNQYGCWDDAERFLLSMTYNPFRLQQLNDEVAELYASQFKKFTN
jgi:hypothetical protein